MSAAVAGTFYVYEHIRNDTGEVFYVGKGCGIRSQVTSKRNGYWKNIVAKAGGFRVKKIAEDVDEELAFLVEVERIDQLRAMGRKLCNMTSGGEGLSGYVATAETRRKWSESRMGRVFSDETRLKLSKRKIGNRHMVGKSRDASTKEKISKTLLGKPKPKLQCPHCLMVGGANGLTRYHFDKCKNAPLTS